MPPTSPAYRNTFRPSTIHLLRNTITYLLLLFFICPAISGYGQAKLKRAKKEMAVLNYSEAISLFEQVVKKKDRLEARVLLAECYRKINNWENAAYQYSQIIQSKESKPIHKLYYGQALQRSGQCEEAKQWFEKYVKEKPGDARGKHLLNACVYETELRTKNLNVYEIQNLPINTEANDMCPMVFDKGFVFSSDRNVGISVRHTDGWTGKPFLDLYYIDALPIHAGQCSEYHFDVPINFSNVLNSRFHELSASFTNKENTVFYTSNNTTDRSRNPISTLNIYFAHHLGDGMWSPPTPFPFNSTTYSTAHPAVRADGTKVFFSSNMPGGYGGMDIYVSEFRNGEWHKPINLGPIINTEGNETFPYIHESGYLYFSSDGQVGLGGMDIYRSRHDGSNWSDAENLGYPINSSADDFGISFYPNNHSGFFTSNRVGGFGGDDIYTFCKKAVPVEIYVYDIDTKLPVAGATISNNYDKRKITTGSDGRAVLDVLYGHCYAFSAQKIDYLEKSEEDLCTHFRRKVYISKYH